MKFTGNKASGVRVRKSAAETRISLAVAVAAILVGLALAVPAPAQVVPQAKTSAGPALTTYGSNTILAWAGVSGQSADGQTVHKVAYKYYDDGAWEPQQFLTPYPAVSTTSAPALATAGTSEEADLSAYMAWRQDDGLVHYTVWDNTSNTFSDAPKIFCSTAACETTTSPALAGDSTTLYVAWTTESGGIRYATCISDGGCTNDDWTIYAAAVPGVNTSVAPALTVLGNHLYLAWVNKSGQIKVESAPLPLAASGVVWSSVPSPAGTTSVAPALAVGFSGLEPLHSTNVLVMASNNGSAINYTYWNGASWTPLPGPTPPGPLENFSPALQNYYGQSTDICDSQYLMNVAFTLAGSEASEVDWAPVEDQFYVPPSCKMP